MNLDLLMTERAVLKELGRRLARHRRERNWTQAEASAQAGIGQATLQRIERGESVQMTSMVKLLRAQTYSVLLTRRCRSRSSCRSPAWNGSVAILLGAASATANVAAQAARQ